MKNSENTLTWEDLSGLSFLITDESAN